MPKLEWIGKDKVISHHLDVPVRVLNHKYGFRGDSSDSTETNSGNMIIHGDNLEALKALLPRYEGQIDCIYIDPPYNTGNENWVYNDNVNDPKIKKWLGEVVGTEGEDLCRHDKWLCMMYPRLVLLRELLSDNGVIFISIDDNELANLKCICDEIFGLKNFVATFTWVRKKKGSFLSSTVRRMTEYVICFQKNSLNNLSFFGEKAYSDKWQPIVKRTNGLKTLVFPENLITTKLSDGHYDAGFRGKEGTGMTFNCPFDVKDGKIISRIEVEGHFTWQQSFLDNEIANGTAIDLSKQFGFNVLRFDQEDKIKAPSTLISQDNGVGTNEDATAELQLIFGGQPNNIFQYSKPRTLIEYLINMVLYNKKRAIILDAFAGSGTTAHAVLNLNIKDGGARKFILCEMCDYAETVTAERVRRVIKGYGKGSNSINGVGGSFDYFELGDTIFTDNKLLNDNIPEEKIREYIYYTETCQPLTRPWTNSSYLLDTFENTSYYFYYIPREITTLGHNTLNIVTEKTENYVIYADRCTLSEDYMLKHNIVFKKIPRDIKHF